MNELDAINIMLEEGGRTRPVSQIEFAPGNARKMLDRAKISVLKSGRYPLNTEKRDFIRETDGIVRVASDILAIHGLPSEIVVRDNKLWHRENLTDIMTTDYNDLEVLVDVDFEKMDESVQEFIAYTAAARFAAARRGPESPSYAYCIGERDTKEVELSMKYPAETASHGGRWWIAGECGFGTNSTCVWVR